MAEVDLAALRKNVDVLQATVGPGVGVLAVVKADAYGHGALACARALERKVWGFAVSLVEEGVELRRGGIEAPIVVLGSFYGYSHRDVIAFRLTPVVSDEGDVEKFARAADEMSAGRVGLHLKVDTGMSRLGVRLERLDAMLQRIVATTAVELTGLCSHLASADADDAAPSEAQLATFAEAQARVRAAGLSPALTHVANSAATVRFGDARFDLVRPGLALYGYNASPSAAYTGLLPAMSLKSRIVALRDLAAGDHVSYGGMWKSDRAARIATVPIGYADGYTRRMTGKACALVGGRRCVVAGAITMDMCMVDVTDVAEAKLGDEVVLLGAQGGERIDADELAGWAGTISWEIFCGISKRVPRVYVGERW
ncbi:MAG: alanine racemase [Myxococcales bacterium]|nr:alanine racemase [Myxococcales bacterium]